MKGKAEKEHDADVQARAEIQGKFEALRALFHGLKRSRREYPAVESLDFEPIEGGQVLVLRMLYPYEMVRVELSDDQVKEMVNRAQGHTAEGIQVATPAEAAAILGQTTVEEMISASNGN